MSNSHPVALILGATGRTGSHLVNLVEALNMTEAAQILSEELDKIITYEGRVKGEMLKLF